jgi:hypothetical protein
MKCVENLSEAGDYFSLIDIIIDSSIVKKFHNFSILFHKKFLKKRFSDKIMPLAELIRESRCFL